MTDKPHDESFGENVTRAGDRSLRRPDDESVGDHNTLSGAAAADDSPIEDDIEIVDLSARYQLGRILGKGGMGEVGLATDTRLKRDVAIKRVHGEMAKSRTALRRFLTEAQSVARLNHFNVVQIYDYGRDKDGPFLILEYVDGDTLQKKLQSGPIPVSEAVDLTCQLCDGLAKAHALGIIHRDIKPANILLTAEGNPKLTDFGLARDHEADTGHTVTGSVLGTLDFMPPEQRKDAALTDARSDLWSLAATLYQMVTGESPRVIDLEGVPPQLKAVISKALKARPNERYQTASELRDALKTAIREDATQTQAESELGAGECPSCHKKNEAGRKFCRECAASLEVNCLSCQKPMPAWDKVCGQCGVKQQDVIDSRRGELERQLERAEDLRRESKFSSAQAAARKIVETADPRFVFVKEWAEKFLKDVDQELSQERQRLSGILTEALAHEAVYDWTAAIRTLEQVPIPMRQESVSTADGMPRRIEDVLQRLYRVQSEYAELEATIRERNAKREFQGVLPLVNRLLELRPTRVTVQKMKGQLEQWEKKRAAASEQLYREVSQLQFDDKIKEALSRLKGLKDGDLSPELLLLQQEIEQAQELFQSISETLQAEKAGGTELSTKELQNLIKKADRYLRLSPNSERIKQLRKTLETRQASYELQRQAQQKQFIRRIVTAASLIVLVIVAGLGAWIYSSAKQAAALAAQKAFDEAMERGTDGLKRGDAVAANEAFTDAIKRKPTEASAFEKRAAARLRLITPDIEGALADLQTAKQMEPGALSIPVLEAEANVVLGIVQAKAGKLTEAEATLVKCQELKADADRLFEIRAAIAAAWVAHAEQETAAGQLAAAFAALESAVRIGGDPAGISAARAAALVRRAQQAIAANDRKAAANDFLEAKSLDSSVAGLSELAAVLAASLVDACESSFNETTFMQATAALQTVAELDSTSNALPGLKTRLGKVLAVQAAKAIDLKAIDRVGEILTAMIDLQLEPEKQVRISNSLVGLYKERSDQEIASGQLTEAVGTLSSIHALQLADAQTREQINTVLVPAVQSLALKELGKDEPTPAIEALILLAAIAKPDEVFITQLRERVSKMPDSVTQALTPGVLPSPLRLDPSVVLALNFDDLGEKAVPELLNLAMPAARIPAKDVTLVDGVHGKAANLHGKPFDLPREGMPLDNSPRTIAAWVKLQNPNANDQMPFNYGTMEANDAVYVIVFGNNSGRSVKLRPFVGNPGGQNERGSGRVISDGQWHHIALVYDGGQLTTLYLDKQEDLQFAKAYNTTWGEGYGRKLDVHCFAGGFVGAMDDFVVVSRAMSSTEIGRLADIGFQSLYRDSTPVATTEQPQVATELAKFTEGLIAHYPLRGDLQDASGRGNHAQTEGAFPTVGRLGENNGAYAFDGNKSVVFAPNKAYLNLNKPNDFTVSFWAKRTEACDFSFIIAKDLGNRPNSSTKWIVILGKYQIEKPTLQFHWIDQKRRSPFLRSNPIPWDLDWHCYVITRSGELFTFFMDGKQIGSQKEALSLPSSNPGEFTIGNSKTEGEGSFNGSISDVRVYSRAFSTEAVRQLHEFESKKHSIKRD